MHPVVSIARGTRPMKVQEHPEIVWLAAVTIVGVLRWVYYRDHLQEEGRMDATSSAASSSRIHQFKKVTPDGPQRHHAMNG
ncbi:MAG: hypothetical protein IPM68_03185 [Flavobacteriales bacterium]|nr:hypothetical protein [Flavobacteriales bacterium]